MCHAAYTDTNLAKDLKPRVRLTYTNPAAAASAHNSTERYHALPNVQLHVVQQLTISRQVGDDAVHADARSQLRKVPLSFQLEPV